MTDSRIVGDLFEKQTDDSKEMILMWVGLWKYGENPSSLLSSSQAQLIECVSLLNKKRRLLS